MMEPLWSDRVSIWTETDSWDSNHNQLVEMVEEDKVIHICLKTIDPPSQVQNTEQDELPPQGSPAHMWQLLMLL